MAGNWSALVYLDAPKQSRSPSPAVAASASTNASKGAGRRSISTGSLTAPGPMSAPRTSPLETQGQPEVPRTPPCAPGRAPLIKPQPTYKPQLKPYRVGDTIIIMQNYLRTADSPIILPNGQSVYPRCYELPPTLLKSINYAHAYGLAKGAKYPLQDKDGKPILEGQAFPKYAEVWREGGNIVVRASRMNDEEIALMLEKREKRARRWGF